MLLQVGNAYLDAYLEMVEDTESPRIFHLWSALSILGSSLGRRCFFKLGHKIIYPNQYVVLVGTPGMRKSTAMSIGETILKTTTGIKFAPDDTSGQRQGLIKEMIGTDADAPKFLEGQILASDDKTISGLSLAQISQISDETQDEHLFEIANADREHLAAFADEFSTFVGENSGQLLQFLSTCWDGKSYKYSLKNSSTILKKPLLNILGCTTPVSLAKSMPKAAAGQGILSRMILVYGSRKYKSIARPQGLNPECEEIVRQIVSHSYSNLAGEFRETPEAEALGVKLYDIAHTITDSRFTYYAERRYTHLIKLAMILCASRGEMEIIPGDYLLANKLLTATELGMPDALGEFGLNEMGTLKQGLLEFMRDVGSMEFKELRANFHRDATSQQFMEVMHELILSKQLVMQKAANGNTFVSASMGKYATDDKITQMLSQQT